jgi:hypothetical protein
MLNQSAALTSRTLQRQQGGIKTIMRRSESHMALLKFLLLAARSSSLRPALVQNFFVHHRSAIISAKLANATDAMTNSDNKLIGYLAPPIG